MREWERIPVCCLERVEPTALLGYVFCCVGRIVLEVKLESSFNVLVMRFTIEEFDVMRVLFVDYELAEIVGNYKTVVFLFQIFHRLPPAVHGRSLHI